MKPISCLAMRLCLAMCHSEAVTMALGIFANSVNSLTSSQTGKCIPLMYQLLFSYQFMKQTEPGDELSIMLQFSNSISLKFTEF